ncbi:MAG: HAMP domain-containing histidine kinase [Acidobacteriota bacterium]|nr:HAMP domain-containing histidine kinase [Acidobacteriota bacterium]
MAPENRHNPVSEREQTDESLRVERERADNALALELAAIDETADAVINRARARADAVLAASRAKTDREPAPLAHSVDSQRVIQRERVLADAALRDERATADETLRQERAAQVSILSVERDETDKDLLSERARSDDMLATRDEFLGIVSHDLRTMLGTLSGFASLIADGVTREDHVEQVLRDARRIQRTSVRMNRLVGDLVDVASIEAGSLAVTREVGDPAHLVTEAVDTFQAQAAAAGVSLVAEIVSPTGLAAHDPARILQVIANLLSNALKFTASTGRVVVRVERVGEDIRFAVSDTGVGISAHDLDSVFVRFVQVTQNDRRGVGLGLYISKCIVQGHGGRIWVESGIGAGSTFYFTLPVHSPTCRE